MAHPASGAGLSQAEQWEGPGTAWHPTIRTALVVPMAALESLPYCVRSAACSGVTWAWRGRSSRSSTILIVRHG